MKWWREWRERNWVKVHFDIPGGFVTVRSKYPLRTRDVEAYRAAIERAWPARKSGDSGKRSESEHQ